MSLRRAGRYISVFLFVVALISGFAWFVLWGYGEGEMATIAIVIAFISFTVGATLLGLSAVRSNAPSVVETRTVVHQYRPMSRPPSPPPPPPPGRPLYPDFKPGGASDMTPEQEAMANRIMDSMIGGDHPPPVGTVVYEEVRYSSPPPPSRFPSQPPSPLDIRTQKYDRALNEMGHWSHDMSKALEKGRRFRPRR
jgi:hypothetical protein